MAKPVKKTITDEQIREFHILTEEIAELVQAKTQATDSIEKARLQKEYNEKRIIRRRLQSRMSYYKSGKTLESKLYQNKLKQKTYKLALRSKLLSKVDETRTQKNLARLETTAAELTKMIEMKRQQ